VLAPCPDCGDVRVDIDACTLLLCVDDGRLAVAYLCPRCRRRDAVDLTRQSDRAPALVGAGIRVRTWHLPAELNEPRPGGPAFGGDDVLDWHAAMQSPDWLDELLGTD
jgi:hypothetical protein